MRSTHQLSEWPQVAFVRSELYRLLSTVLASAPIAKAATTRAGGLEDLLDISALEDQAITQSLISVAINLRMLDDRFGQPMKHLDVDVGILIEGLSPTAASGKNASVREACNKIIHAASVEVERITLAEYCTHVDSTVTFYGRTSNRRDGWCLKLDLVGFVHEAMLGLVEIEHGTQSGSFQK